MVLLFAQFKKHFKMERSLVSRSQSPAIFFQFGSIRRKKIIRTLSPMKRSTNAAEEEQEGKKNIFRCSNFWSILSHAPWENSGAKCLSTLSRIRCDRQFFIFHLQSL